MNRRRFLLRGAGGAGAATLATTLASTGALGLLSGCMQRRAPGAQTIQVAGLSLPDLAADYERRLFDEYLPFWEKGGYDDERGGFMCYLHDDGSVQDDRKDIWYQGRGVWVYAYLYNFLDSSPRWLEVARKSRDFMVQYMHRGDGTWRDTVDRFGNPVPGIDPTRDGNVYGALFATAGLLQLAAATGSGEDLDLAKRSLRKSVARYEDPTYPGVTAAGVSESGLRAQGHSFMIAWLVPQLLAIDDDPWFRSLLEQHLDHIEHDFWNPEYGISNETLLHDYTRITRLKTRMVPGHSIETQWMAMDAADTLGQPDRAELFQNRMRRLTEMSWDYVYGGVGDTDFSVFGADGLQAGPELSIKTMWAQTEVLVGMMRVYAATGAPWARDWYERARQFTLDTMTTGIGVWRQAVDRTGNPKERPGVSPFRKGNFHQPRCLMMNLRQIRRMAD